MLIGGNFMSERAFATRRYTAAEAVAPLAAVRARFRTAAVLETTIRAASARTTCAPPWRASALR
jgi:hypothetical protein